MNNLIFIKKNIEIIPFSFVKYIICCCMIFFPMLQYGQNLIVNPDCEEPLVGGEIPDWTEVVGTSWGTGGINPTAQSGSVYFYAGANSSAELAQDIDVSAHAVSIDNNSQSFTFSGYVTFKK